MEGEEFPMNLNGEGSNGSNASISPSSSFNFIDNRGISPSHLHQGSSGLFSSVNPLNRGLSGGSASSLPFHLIPRFEEHNSMEFQSNQSDYPPKSSNLTFRPPGVLSPNLGGVSPPQQHQQHQQQQHQQQHQKHQHIPPGHTPISSFPEGIKVSNHNTSVLLQGFLKDKNSLNNASANRTVSPPLVNLTSSNAPVMRSNSDGNLYHNSGPMKRSYEGVPISSPPSSPSMTSFNQLSILSNANYDQFPQNPSSAPHIHSQVPSPPYPTYPNSYHNIQLNPQSHTNECIYNQNRDPHALQPNMLQHFPPASQSFRSPSNTQLEKKAKISSSPHPPPSQEKKSFNPLDTTTPQSIQFSKAHQFLGNNHVPSTIPHPHQRKNSVSMQQTQKKPQAQQQSQNSTKTNMVNGNFCVNELGTIIYDNDNYHNTDMIFPLGFCSYRIFSSILHPGQNNWWRCEIKAGDKGPMFALNEDPLERDLFACNNLETLMRVLVSKCEAAKVPLPPGHTINGGAFFGLTIADVLKKIESLPNANKLRNYKSPFTTSPTQSNPFKQTPSETYAQQIQNLTTILSTKVYSQDQLVSARNYVKLHRSKEIKPCDYIEHLTLVETILEEYPYFPAVSFSLKALLTNHLNDDRTLVERYFSLLKRLGMVLLVDGTRPNPRFSPRRIFDVFEVAYSRIDVWSSVQLAEINRFRIMAQHCVNINNIAVAKSAQSGNPNNQINQQASQPIGYNPKPIQATGPTNPPVKNAVAVPMKSTTAPIQALKQNSLPSTNKQPPKLMKPPNPSVIKRVREECRLNNDAVLEFSEILVAERVITSDCYVTFDLAPNLFDGVETGVQIDSNGVERIVTVGLQMYDACGGNSHGQKPAYFVNVNSQIIPPKYQYKEPYHINKLVRCGRNIIKIQPNVQGGVVITSSFLFTVIYKRYRPIGVLLDQVQKGNVRPSKSVIINAIKNSFGQDKEIEQISMPLSLRCPITREKIQIAGRSLQCRHVGAFCLVSFIKYSLKMPRNKWICPICTSPLLFKNLYVDEFVQNIVDKLKETSREDVEIVHLDREGNWSLPVKKSSRQREEITDLVPVEDSEEIIDICESTWRKYQEDLLETRKESTYNQTDLDSDPFNSFIKSSSSESLNNQNKLDSNDDFWNSLSSPSGANEELIDLTSDNSDQLNDYFDQMLDQSVDTNEKVETEEHDFLIK